MANAPGEGSLVTITDPEGYPLNVIFGQEPTNANVSHPDKLVVNFTGEKPRRRDAASLIDLSLALLQCTR